MSADTLPPCRLCGKSAFASVGPDGTTVQCGSPPCEMHQHDLTPEAWCRLMSGPRLRRLREGETIELRGLSIPVAWRIFGDYWEECCVQHATHIIEGLPGPEDVEPNQKDSNE